MGIYYDKEINHNISFLSFKNKLRIVLHNFLIAIAYKNPLLFIVNNTGSVN